MSRESSVAVHVGDPANPDPATRLREALDALVEGFWLLDAVRDASGRITDFAVVDINRRAARMASVEPSEARGRLLGEIAPMARSLGHIERYAAIVDGGEAQTHQFSAVLADGAVVWRCMNAVRSGDGVAVTIRDVTERVVQGRARAAAEDDLRLLAENATDMITRMTPEGRFTHVSPASRDIMGFPPDEMVGRLAADFVHPDDLPALVARRETLTGRSMSAPVTYRAQRRSGGWVRLETRSRGILDGEGTLREIRTSTRDVTERALVEAEHAALHRVSEAVAAGLEQAGLYSLVAAEIAHLLDAVGGRVVRFIDDSAAEVLGSWRHASLPQTLSGERLRLDPTWAISRARLTGATALAGLNTQAGVELRMAIAAPVRFEGRVWGAVAAAFRHPDDVPDGAAMRVERFAKLVGLAVANAEARTRLLVQATTDALTGLANHGAFHAALADEFARTDRYGHPLSLAVIDLDRFKTLNDTFGHRAGDAALATMGALLRGHARQADVVGRVGGEELAWLMPSTGLEGALEAAERLRRAIAAAPVSGPLGLTASIGLARRSRYEPDSEHLYRRADAALYRAKQTGRDRVVVDPA